MVGAGGGAQILFKFLTGTKIADVWLLDYQIINLPKNASNDIPEVYINGI